MMEKKYLHGNTIPVTKLSLIRDNSSGLTAINYTPVKIEVIEKYSNGEKVLINGKLYITELPIDLEIGDVVVGKVIKSNPLTVSLDIKKENGARKVDRILKILSIKNNSINNELINLLLVMQKPLVKKYVEEFIEIMQSGGFNYSFDELKVLTHLIWNVKGRAVKKTLKRYSEVFNESFEITGMKIFEILNTLKIESIDKSLTDKIWSVFVSEKDEDLPVVLKDKTNKELEILTLLNNRDTNSVDLYRSGIKSLKSCLEKLVLQKSFYANAGIYKDFIIMKTVNGYKHYFVKYEPENESGVSNLLINTGESEEKIIGYLTKNIIYGEIHSPATGLISEYLINEFNGYINSKLKIKSYLRFKRIGAKPRKRNIYKSVANYS